MRKTFWILGLVLSVFLSGGLFTAPPADAADCYAAACAGCGRDADSGQYLCEFSSAGTHCSCTIRVWSDDHTACGLDGTCVYTSGGGGTAPGGGGGGAGSCVILPGAFCPSGCASCTVNYWY